jgi:hypothetical protein
VQKHTQALMSVKDPGNTIDLNPRRQSSWPLGVSVKGIVRAFNWLKCLGGFLHLKPTVGCHISPLIFENAFMERGLHKVDIWHPADDLRCRNPHRHLSRLKVQAIPLTWAPSGQELCRPWYIFHGIFIETLLHKKKSNIKVDIWHPAVGLTCRNPPRHLSQLRYFPGL